MAPLLMVKEAGSEPRLIQAHNTGNESICTGLSQAVGIYGIYFLHHMVYRCSRAPKKNHRRGYWYESRTRSPHSVVKESFSITARCVHEQMVLVFPTADLWSLGRSETTIFLQQTLVLSDRRACILPSPLVELNSSLRSNNGYGLRVSGR